MAQPAAQDVHISIPLTNISLAWLQSNADKFIADKVFPVVPVNYQYGKFYKFPRSNWLRPEAKVRAPAAESAGSGFTIVSQNYSADVYAIHYDLPDQVLANADAALSIDRSGTEFVTQQVALTRELIWTQKFFTTGVWSGIADQTGVPGVAGANQFKQWDQAGSTPIEDLTKYRIAMTLLTGFRPNTLVIGPQVWAILMNHAEFLDRIKYTQTGIVGTDLLAALIGIPNVYVPEAIQNTANEGQADTMGFLYGKNVLMTYSAPSPGLMTPSAGYIFAWDGFLGANALGGRVKRFRMEWLEATRIEAEMAFDMNAVAPEMGGLLTAAVS